jgi:hypothetical protein
MPSLAGTQGNDFLPFPPGIELGSCTQFWNCKALVCTLAFQVCGPQVLLPGTDTTFLDFALCCGYDACMLDDRFFTLLPWYILATLWILVGFPSLFFLCLLLACFWISTHA